MGCASKTAGQLRCGAAKAKALAGPQILDHTMVGPNISRLNLQYFPEALRDTVPTVDGNQNIHLPKKHAQSLVNFAGRYGGDYKIPRLDLLLAPKEAFPSGLSEFHAKGFFESKDQIQSVESHMITVWRCQLALELMRSSTAPVVIRR
jgi:hypothetical protein